MVLSAAKKRLLLFGVSLLSFTGFLDATIVSTALPNIQTSLNMSVSQLQWIMNAFFLGISAFMASMGRIGDIYGRRKVFYVGTLIFGLASVGAGFATSAGFLIFCRAFQGITTAITIPVAIAIIQTAHDKHEIAKAMGLFGTITGAGLALGPFLGGVLVTAFGWPAVFFVNIPFIIIGFMLCFWSVEESRSNTKMSLDYFGILFLILTTGSLVFGMVQGNSLGWSSATIKICFSITLISLLLFIFVERKVKDPIMAGYLFKNRIFVPCMLYSFAAGSAMSIVLFINPLYLHTILAQSNFMTGVILFIIPIVVVVFAYIVGHAHHHLGSKTLLIIGSLAFLATAILHMTLGVNLSLLLIIPTFFCMGLGWAIVNTVPGAALGMHIESDHIGVAIGALFSFYNIGAAVLLALSVALFHIKALASLKMQFVQHHIALNSANEKWLHMFVNQPNKMQQVIGHIGVQHGQVQEIFKQAFISGFHLMFFPIIILSLISFFAIVFIMKRKSLAEVHE